MEYVYTPVATGDREDKFWKYVLRQIFISSGPWSIYFATGLCFGTPTVMIPQLRQESSNSTNALNENIVSWLTSVYGYSALPWTLILPILSEIYGRKLPFQITFITMIIGQCIWYLSTSVFSILIAEIIVSIMLSCNMTISVVIIGEYASPRYRGIFLTIKSISFYWGVWVANTIGTFFYWKIILMLELLCTAYAATSFFWPESPHWLATKERFEECTASHRLLKGTSKEAEHELQQLINSQKHYSELDHSTREALFSCEWLISFVKVFSKKVVYKPILLSLATMSMFHLSGKLACSMYAIEILKKITEQESTAYKGMLILDAVSILGMYLGCYLTKKLKRRTLLISAASFSILFLFTLSLYLYLIKLGYLTEYSIVSITLLTIISMSISCGPMMLATIIFAETIPLRYKGSTVIAIILMDNILISTVLKISLYIFRTAGLHGAFFFYGFCVSILLFILYKYLPETKDKTLLEIEELFEK